MPLCCTYKEDFCGGPGDVCDNGHREYTTGLFCPTVSGYSVVSSFAVDKCSDCKPGCLSMTDETLLDPEEKSSNEHLYKGKYFRI